MRHARISQDKGTLDGAENVALFSAPIGGERATRGQGGDRIRLVLPLGPGGSLRKVGAQGRRGCGATRRCQTCSPGPGQPPLAAQACH